MPVPAMDRAFATFVDSCYGSAPSFQSFGAKTRGYAQGVNGWFNHARFNLSVVLREDSSRYSCQFAFTSNEGNRTFASMMNTPFNAREVTRQELGQILKRDASGLIAVDAQTLSAIDRAFVGKTDFDGKPASFFGFIFEDQGSKSNGSRYGLMLQVSK